MSMKGNQQCNHNKKNNLGSYLVDTVGLNGWVNEFGDELAFEILSNVCFIVLLLLMSKDHLIVPLKRTFWLRP